MGKMTFRKSFKLPGGVRINASSKGIGASVGVRGFRVTQRADGRVTRTISIPGTGLSQTDTLRPSTAARARAAASLNGQGQPLVSGRPSYWLGFVLNVLLPGAGMLVVRAWGWAFVWVIAAGMAVGTGHPPLLLLVIVGALFHYRALYAQRFLA